MSVINRVGLWTLFIKEVRRFSAVWMQTVLSPLITNSLYFLVFGVALGSRLKTIDGVPYIQYVVPGLIMLGIISNSFLNTSSSLFQSKINGTIIDVLVAPLGTLEFLIAYLGAALVRASIVGFLIYLVAMAFTPFEISSHGWAFFFAIATGLSFALLGLIAALWAEKYDHLSIFPNFVLTPLVFLGGVFYSIEMLPEPWHTISLFNPLLYIVNGMRYGLLGVSDVEVMTSAVIVVAALIALTFSATLLLIRGYNLRA